MIITETTVFQYSEQCNTNYKIWNTGSVHWTYHWGLFA